MPACTDTYALRRLNQSDYPTERQMYSSSASQIRSAPKMMSRKGRQGIAAPARFLGPRCLAAHGRRPTKKERRRKYYTNSPSSRSAVRSRLDAVVQASFPPAAPPAARARSGQLSRLSGTTDLRVSCLSPMRTICWVVAIGHPPAPGRPAAGRGEGPPLSLLLRRPLLLRGGYQRVHDDVAVSLGRSWSGSGHEGCAAFKVSRGLSRRGYIYIYIYIQQGSYESTHQVIGIRRRPRA